MGLDHNKERDEYLLLDHYSVCERVGVKKGRVTDAQFWSPGFSVRTAAMFFWVGVLSLIFLILGNLFNHQALFSAAV